MQRPELCVSVFKHPYESNPSPVNAVVKKASAVIAVADRKLEVEMHSSGLLY